MRTLKFLVPAAATALALAACSEAPEPTTDETAMTDEAATDAAEAETTVLDANTATITTDQIST